jgi:hypothetical protein
MPTLPFVVIGEKGARLQTYFPTDGTPQRIHVQLRANRTFPKGQVLCPVLATPGLYDAPGAGAVNSRQTITVTGGPTGGVIVLRVNRGGAIESAEVPYNATATQVEDALESLNNVGLGNVHCTGGALPGTGVVAEFQGQAGGQPFPTMTVDYSGLTGGSSPAAAVVSTQTGVSGGLGPAECLLEYPAITDANGKITIGTIADPLGQKWDSVPAYIEGNFLCADLAGLGSDLTIANQLGTVKGGNQDTGILYMGRK